MVIECLRGAASSRGRLPIGNSFADSIRLFALRSLPQWYPHLPCVLGIQTVTAQCVVARVESGFQMRGTNRLLECVKATSLTPIVNLPRLQGGE